MHPRLLVALLFLSSAPAYADGVSFHGSARLRLRSERNLPDTVVRYDAAANAFALSGYLNSEEAESRVLFLAAGLAGARGPPPGRRSPLGGHRRHRRASPPRGFLGVSPYLTETSIFFGGGLSESFADRQVHASGVNGRGVIAPILSFRWDPSESLSLSAKAAWLRAAEPGPWGGSVHGSEVDATVRWEPLDWLSFGLESDTLVPGDFFAGRRPITRGILAIDVQSP